MVKLAFVSLFPYSVAFRRVGRSIKGSALHEVSEATWLCVGSYFSDLRFPYSGSVTTDSLDVCQAFSGQCLIDGDKITWRHDFDTLDRDNAYEDRAHFVWNENLLIEVGDDYSEHWSAVTPDNPTSCGVAELTKTRIDGSNGSQISEVIGRIVQVEAIGIAIWLEPQHVAAFLNASPTWKVTKVVGSKEPRKDIVGVVSALAAKTELPKDWNRVV